MPSHTVKQAKVMSAISHGWHPDSGSVAKIPLKVAKEFHAADAGHKYGKGGKHKADGGAVEGAMHHVRHYAKKADGGGDLDETPDPFAAEKFVPPPIAASMPQTAQHDVEALRNFATTNRPDQSQENVRFKTASPLANITDEDIERGTNAAMSAGTGMGAPKGFTAKGAKMVGDIHDAVLEATGHYGAPDSSTLSKTLKTFYPKDIAASAAYLGVAPEDLPALKSHMTPGAVAAFEKHYDKIVGSKPQAGFPKAHVLTPAQEEMLHGPGGAYAEESTPTARNEQSMQDYEDYIDSAQEHDQLINEGGISDRQPSKSVVKDNPHPTKDDLHPSLIPPDLEQKAGKLGLNVSAFHGTPYNFSEFKLPEEMGKMPEIGVHFGTLKAALDRNFDVTGNGHENMRRYFARNEGIERANNNLALTSDFSPKWKIIPSKIGISKPLNLFDLGTWTPSRIAEGLTTKPEFSHSEIKSALGSYHPADLNGKSAQTAMVNLRKLIESKGYDSISYRNAVEDPGSTSYIIWNLNKARSFYAKFDPAHANSRNIGAGLAGLSLVPLGLRQASGEPEQKAKGGEVKKKHPQIDEDPQDHEFINFASGGLIDSHIPGRTDKIPMKVATGAYVLPADIPSALGQGNSKAGAEILKKMFTHGAYGLPPPNIHGKEFRAPHMLNNHFSKHADGGEADHVPIVAAGGEYVIHPDVVKAVGGGSMSKGHKVLDQFVLHTRKQNINTLKKLKPPK